LEKRLSKHKMTAF